MKNKFRSLLLIAVMTTPVIVVAVSIDNSRILQRCKDDKLTHAEALARNNWAQRCQLISRRTWDFNVNDDNGNIRTRIKYPSFFHPQNFDDWVSAPAVANAPCDIKGYTSMLHCLSEE